MIKVGEKIKELRQREGRTQEALANEIGVTAQAVSRWEKGICYPDMEVIPPIANYFGVSIDELFGYDNERSIKIDALVDQINEMIRQNNGTDSCMNECIAAAREALIEFPGNEKLTLALASALYTAGYVRHGEHHFDGNDGFRFFDTERHKGYSEWQEAIKLYEKLLLSLRDGKMRQQTVVELSQLYKNTGEYEKALLLAQSAPDISASKPLLRINAFSGKEEVAACGEALMDLVMRSTELIETIVRTDRQMPSMTAAEMLGNATCMFDLVYADHFYGKSNAWLACLHMLRSYYLWISNEKDDAFEALNTAMTCAKRYDQLCEISPEYYSSPLLRYVKTRTEVMPDNCAFSKELPEVWPWWCVPEREKVKAEMQKDPRWNEWQSKSQ